MSHSPKYSTDALIDLLVDAEGLASHVPEEVGGLPPSPGEALSQVIQQARADTGRSLGDLSVLADNDPFRIDTPARRRDAGWIAGHLAPILATGRTLHPRGIHYLLVAQGNIVKPNGQTYRNSEEDWAWLSEDVLTAARWLGTIGFDQVNDARNEAPIVVEPRGSPQVLIGANLEIDLPEGDDFEPRVQVANHIPPQPYTLILAGEKTSLAEVLRPIAQEYGAGLFLPNGNMSDRMVYDMAMMIERLGRPAVVFYFSDFDPSGYGMPAELGRKLQALCHMWLLNEDVTVYAPALTKQQCIAEGLPSTPLKATEQRADKWKAAIGWEQTEIDALATLRPQVLARIARAALDPFFDRTLKARADEAVIAYSEEQTARLHDYLDEERIAEIRSKMETRISEVREQLEDLQRQLAVPADDLGLDDYVPPAPILGGLPPDYPEPLLDPTDDWVEQTDRLRGRKLK